MLKGAIVGFGQVVENGHVPAFRARAEHFQIIAAADSIPPRLRAAEKAFPGIRTYASFAALLEKEPGLDFAVIATPPVYHKKDILLALGRGLHVLSEKPLVLSRGDFEEVRDLAREKGLCVFTVHNWKKAPPMLKVSELIKSGSIGKVQHFELHVLREKPAASASSVKSWRQDPAIAGGGIMVDHGWHNFYLACGMAGEIPEAVTADLGFPGQDGGGPAAEDLAACWIKFPAVTGLVYLTWRSMCRKNFGVVYGSGGLLEIRDSDIILERKGEQPKTFATGEKLSAGSAHPTWMPPLLDDFLLELKEPGERGGNLLEAELCLLLLEGAFKSQESGGTVGIPAPSCVAALKSA